jgi:hypothetical protein
MAEHVTQQVTLRLVIDGEAQEIQPVARDVLRTALEILQRQNGVERQSAYPNPLSVMMLCNGELIGEFKLGANNDLIPGDFL